MPTPEAQLKAVLRTSPRFDGTKTLLLDPELSLCRWVWIGCRCLGACAAAGPVCPFLPTWASAATRVLTDTMNSMQVAVNAAADSYLVLDDDYYPGWQVTIDGQRAPINRADYSSACGARAAG